MRSTRSLSTRDSGYNDIYNDLDKLDDFYDPFGDSEVAEEEYGMIFNPTILL